MSYEIVWFSALAWMQGRSKYDNVGALSSPHQESDVIQVYQTIATCGLMVHSDQALLTIIYGWTRML